MNARDIDAAGTLMWEARAAQGRLDELVAFVGKYATAGAQVYRSVEQGLVVVIDPSGGGVPEPPAELVARAAQSWFFERVEPD